MLIDEFMQELCSTSFDPDEPWFEEEITTFIDDALKSSTFTQSAFESIPADPQKRKLIDAMNTFTRTWLRDRAQLIHKVTFKEESNHGSGTVKKS